MRSDRLDAGVQGKRCAMCRGSRPRRLSAVDGGPALLRCGECRGVYWADSWDQERVHDHYQAYYGHGDPVAYDPLTEQRYHAVLDRLERLRPVGRLLDIGCGAGHFLAVAEARGWQSVGVEVSQSALELLRRDKAERALRFAVVEGDLQQAGLPQEDFDVVILIEVIEHLDEPWALLKEVHRLLRAGGILYLTTPNYDSLSRRLLGRRWRVIAEEHRCLFTSRALADCLTDHGFHVLSIGSKNIDVPEILSQWGISRQREHPTERTSASQCFRRAVEGVSWLRHLKRRVNLVLRAWHLGDTLEAFAVKGATG